MHIIIIFHLWIPLDYMGNLECRAKSTEIIVAKRMVRIDTLGTVDHWDFGFHIGNNA
jgi:hypothetical protein